MQRGFFVAFIALITLGASTPAPCGQEQGRNFYRLGVFAYEDGAYADAEIQLLQAAELDPENPAIQHYLGKTYLTLGRLPEAQTHLSQARRIDPDLPGLKSDLAALHFRQADYAEAAALYGELAREETSNVLASYNAGISLYRQERFGEALEQLLEAAERSPSVQANAFYYVGLCYQELGDTAKAAEKFTHVRDHSQNDSLRKSAENALWALKARTRSERRLRFYGRLGGGYDDNVRLAADDDDIAAREGDSFLRAHLSGRYDLVRGDSAVAGLGYSHYQTVYQDLAAFNLIGATPTLYAKLRSGAFSLGFRYSPSFYWLDGDSYLHRHQLRPELRWKIRDRLVSLLAYAYQRDDHRIDDDRDGAAHLGSLDLVHGFGGRKTFVRAGATYKMRTADSPDQEYRQWAVRGGVGFGLFAGIQAALKTRYRGKNYDNVDTDFDQRREDRNFQAGVTLEGHLFADWLGWLLEYGYTRNQSNVDSFDYDRNQVGLSLTARY